MPSLVYSTFIFSSLRAIVPVKSCRCVLQAHSLSSTIVAAKLKAGSGGAGEREGNMGFWLMKTEPGEWSWEHQEQNGGISNWDGVRNALAQKHLRSMQQGDQAFFYHSGKGPAVVGVVEVVKAAYPDSTDESGKSIMVDVRALAALPKPVPLSVIKNVETMRDWILLRQSRLSVMPVSPVVWQRVCELGELSPPPCLPAIADDVGIANIQSTDPERIQLKRRRRDEEKSVLTEAQAAVPLTKAEMQTTVMKQRTRATFSSATEQEPKKRARYLPAKTRRSTSVGNPVEENAKEEAQSTETEALPVAELKTYQRANRKVVAIVEVAVRAPTTLKPKKS